MKYNIKLWMNESRGTKPKKPLHILSFPCISLLNVTVRELITDSELQAKGMKTFAENTDAASAADTAVAFCKAWFSNTYKQKEENERQ